MKIKYLSLKKGGFTLIELMVVIAIIGILTAITTANFTQSKAKARDAKRVSDLAQIQLTLEMFFDRCNAYPSGITLDSTATTCPIDPSTNQTLKLGYFISKIPQESATLNYDYAVNNSRTDYVLRAKLESNSTALTDAITVIPSGLSFPTGDCTHQTSSAYYYCVVPK